MKQFLKIILGEYSMIKNLSVRSEIENITAGERSSHDQSFVGIYKQRRLGLKGVQRFNSSF